MQAIEIKKGGQNKFDDLVQHVSLLDNTDLKTFFEQLHLKISVQKTTAVLSEEIMLLKQIKNMIPVSLIRRFRAWAINNAAFHYNSLKNLECSLFSRTLDFLL